MQIICTGLTIIDYSNNRVTVAAAVADLAEVAPEVVPAVSAL